MKVEGLKFVELEKSFEGFNNSHIHTSINPHIYQSSFFLKIPKISMILPFSSKRGNTFS